MPPSPTSLVLLALAAIGVLVALVTWRKLNAFLALMLAALIVGFGAGLPPLAVLKAFQDGMGATLGGIAAVIALGAMFGKLLAESGGAQVVAEKFIAVFGLSRAVAIVILLGIVVGLVTWFSVAVLLLVPVVVSLTRQSGRPFLLLAIPLVAFLSVMHGLTPPHPGPVVAIDALGANNGKTLALALLVGIPAAWLGGPVFASWAARRIAVPTPAESATAGAVRPRPGFGVTLAVIGLPIGLMLLATVGELLFAPGATVRTTLSLIGHPVSALLVAVLVALWVFRRAGGFGRAEMLAFTEQSVASIGLTLLVVAGGGGFARVLREAGVANALGTLAGELSLPPLIYGWLVAAFIRVATGSATVAITTAAGLLLPLVAADPTINRELLVLALGFGSLVMSHLNDGGFWIVKDCLGLTVSQTLRTWTVVETIIAVAGLGLTVLLSLVF